jgi:hypothetical protein
MSVVPIDPIAAPPVHWTADDPLRKNPHEKPTPHHGQHDHGAPSAEIPSDGTKRAPSSDTVGTMIDVRV